MLIMAIFMNGDVKTSLTARGLQEYIGFIFRQRQTLLTSYYDESSDSLKPQHENSGQDERICLLTIFNEDCDEAEEVDTIFGFLPNLRITFNLSKWRQKEAVTDFLEVTAELAIMPETIGMVIYTFGETINQLKLKGKYVIDRKWASYHSEALNQISVPYKISSSPFPYPFAHLRPDQWIEYLEV
jgi:hypothetical protein